MHIHIQAYILLSTHIFSAMTFLSLLRNMGCSREVIVQFLRPDDRSPHTEKMRSINAWEAAALTKSKATGASLG